jgi:hypothetical protein
MRYFSGDPNIRELKRHFVFFSKIKSKIPRENLLLKSPANTGRLKERRIVSGCPFYSLYRDPVQVYLSNERLMRKFFPDWVSKGGNEFIQEHILYASRTWDKISGRQERFHDQLIEFS